MAIAVIKVLSVFPARKGIETSTSVHVEIRMIQVDTRIKDPCYIRARISGTALYSYDPPRSCLGGPTIPSVIASSLLSQAEVRADGLAVFDLPRLLQASSPCRRAG